MLFVVELKHVSMLHSRRFIVFKEPITNTTKSHISEQSCIFEDS